MTQHDRPGFPTALGRTIRVLRTDAGLDRRMLADQSTISYSYLAAIEAGHRMPSAAVLHRIAAALGLRSHELLAAAERRFDRLLSVTGPGPSQAAETTAERAATLGDLRRILAGLDDDDLVALHAVARRLARRS
jgi:transcriptional regulator with XRE-family HTH domain